MSTNLSAARTAYMTEVKKVTAFGSRVWSGSVPDGETLHDAYGQPAVYAIVNFGRPIPFGNKTLDEAEWEGPHVWPTWVEVYGPDDEAVQAAADALDAVLLGFRPDSTSSGLVGAGAYSYPVQTTELYPQRAGLNRYYTCKVGL